MFINHYFSPNPDLMSCRRELNNLLHEMSVSQNLHLISTPKSPNFTADETQQLLIIRTSSVSREAAWPLNQVLLSVRPLRRRKRRSWNIASPQNQFVSLIISVWTLKMADSSESLLSCSCSLSEPQWLEMNSWGRGSLFPQWTAVSSGQALCAWYAQLGSAYWAALESLRAALIQSSVWQPFSSPLKQMLKSNLLSQKLALCQGHRSALSVSALWRRFNTAGEIWTSLSSSHGERFVFSWRCELLWKQRRQAEWRTAVKGV